MRLFIALPLPPDTRRALAEVQKRLAVVATGGRYVSIENFHITMHFIGESNNLAGAAHICDKAVRGIHPFLLRLDKYGSFQRGGKHTGFISLTGDLDELYRLHESLISALGEEGFSLAGGHKRLTPHITLARGLSHGEEAQDKLRSLTERLGGGASFTANQLTLYQSEANHGGSTRNDIHYTPLHKSHFRNL